MIILSLLLFLNTAMAQSLVKSSNKPNLFLYYSEFPVALEKESKIIKKHIVDSVLYTRKFDLMFSKIPDVLVKTKKSQFILKYKLRTQGFNLYRLELFLIDVNKVIVKRVQAFDNIPHKKLIERIRNATFMFLHNKTVSVENINRFKSLSQKKMFKLGKLTNKSLEKENKPAQFELKDKQLTNIPVVKNKELPQQESLGSPKSRTPSLWDLLKDDDKDIPWVPIKKAQNKKINKIKKITRKARSAFNDLSSIKIAEDDSDSLDVNRIHLSYKYANRELAVSDKIELQTNYHSVLGFSVEWLNYAPLHISPYIFRLIGEFDSPLETEPVQLDAHFNLATSVGYRYSNKYLLGLTYSVDTVNYPNLNIIGEGISPNNITTYWADFDFLNIGIQYNLSFSVGFLLNAKNSGKNQSAEVAALGKFSGNTLNIKYRYYFDDSFIEDIQFWLGLQYREYSLARANQGSDLLIKAQHYIIHYGVFF